MAGPPIDPGGWQIRDTLQAISIPLTLLVAWFASRWQWKNHQRLLLSQEVIRQLGEVTTSCRDVSGSVEQHMTGSYPNGFSEKRACEARKQIMVAMKSVDRRISQLGQIVTANQERALMKGFDAWKRALTSEPFPVLRQADILGPQSAPVAAIQAAQDVVEQAFGLVRTVYLKQ